METAQLKLFKYSSLSIKEKQALINWVYWIAHDLEKSPNNADGMVYSLEL